LACCCCARRRRRRRSRSRLGDRRLLPREAPEVGGGVAVRWLQLEGPTQRKYALARVPRPATQKQARAKISPGVGVPGAEGGGGPAVAHGGVKVPQLSLHRAEKGMGVGVGGQS